jgi:hypothetical protein
MEQLAMQSYDHLVTVDQASRELIIYRIDTQGRRTLFTKTLLPISQGWTSEVQELAKMLGENLLIDSPSARRLLGL